MALVAETLRARFVVAMGDNFYPAGIPTDSSHALFQDVYEDVYTASSLQVPWHVIAGNHDHYGNVSAQLEYSERSARWNFPALYYKRTEPLGPWTDEHAEFYFLDTEWFLPEQAEWLEQELRRGTRAYAYVLGHHPVYSACEHGPTKLLVDLLWPLLQRYNVTAYLAGHDHCQEMYDTGPGPLLAVSGMGALCCYESRISEPQPTWIFSGHEHPAPTGGFLSVRHSPDTAVVVLHDEAGAELTRSRPLRPRHPLTLSGTSAKSAPAPTAGQAPEEAPVDLADFSPPSKARPWVAYGIALSFLVTALIACIFAAVARRRLLALRQNLGLPAGGLDLPPDLELSAVPVAGDGASGPQPTPAPRRGGGAEI